MNVSRRNWLAAAGASMLLPRSIQAADLHGSGDPDVWPVVVVGSGLAGLSAAYSAMQNAAGRVLLLEKGPLIGGHSQYSSGSIATVVPHDPKRSGWQDSVEQFIADALAVGVGATPIRRSSGSNPPTSSSVRFLPRSQVCIRDALRCTATPQAAATCLPWRDA